MASFKLAELYTEITARDAGFNVEISKVDKALKRTKNNVFGLTAAFTKMGRIIKAVASRVVTSINRIAQVSKKMFIALTAAVLAVTIQFASFEQTMALVEARTGATREEFLRLEKQARLMGLTTVFTAKQAAAAMAQFALQGLSVNEIISAIEPTLNLAAAGQLEMAQAALITAGVMRAMQLDVKELGRVTDVLAKTAVTSATDVTQLGEALKAVGAISKTSGLSLEETSTALGILAQRMITGEQAGTALRNILLRLQRQPLEVRKALELLGVGVADASGNFKSFAVIIDEINEGLKKYDEVTKTALISQIGGLRATAALIAILDEGGAKFTELTQDKTGISGFAKQIADIQLDTLTGRFKLMISAITEASIAFGKTLQPSIEFVMHTIRQVAAWLSVLNKEIKEMIIKGAAFSGIAAGMAIFLSLLIAVIGPVNLLIGTLVSLIITLASSMLLASLKGDTLIEKLKDLKDIVIELVTKNKDKIKEYFETFVGGFSVVIAAAKNWELSLRIVTNSVKLHFTSFFLDMKHGLSKFADVFKLIDLEFRNFFRGIGDHIVDFGLFVAQKTDKIMAAMMKFLPGGVPSGLQKKIEERQALIDSFRKDRDERRDEFDEKRDKLIRSFADPSRKTTKKEILLMANIAFDKNELERKARVIKDKILENIAGRNIGEFDPSTQQPTPRMLLPGMMTREEQRKRWDIDAKWRREEKERRKYEESGQQLRPFTKRWQPPTPTEIREMLGKDKIQERKEKEGIGGTQTFTGIVEMSRKIQLAASGGDLQTKMLKTAGRHLITAQEQLEEQRKLTALVNKTSVANQMPSLIPEDASIRRSLGGP